MKNVLTKHLNGVIDRLIETGRFTSRPEVIRAGLRLLEEHEMEFEGDTRADLERILDADLADTRPATPAEQLSSTYRR
jgi:antitoxin ParD1/3/4